MKMCRNQHPCVKPCEHSSQKTNMEWEPSKDWKHVNLKLLGMAGFEDEDKVTNYLRLFMEQAVGRRESSCMVNTPVMNAMPWTLNLSPGDPLSTKLAGIGLRATHTKSSSSVKITIC
ncbi:hypothetical protein ZWY2020_010373 [Hordeum vulgare]|nr:hypothetical protein ZWY2020_010373 [Hordeum vulgare]